MCSPAARRGTAAGYPTHIQCALADCIGGVWFGSFGDGYSSWRAREDGVYSGVWGLCPSGVRGKSSWLGGLPGADSVFIFLAYNFAFRMHKLISGRHLTQEKCIDLLLGCTYTYSLQYIACRCRPTRAYDDHILHGWASTYKV